MYGYQNTVNTVASALTAKQEQERNIQIGEKYNGVYNDLMRHQIAWGNPQQSTHYP